MSGQRQRVGEPDNAPPRTPGQAEGPRADPGGAGEPGKTPGSAEGDRETVDESIRRHERQGAGR
jgi:hypothetical protein